MKLHLTTEDGKYIIFDGNVEEIYSQDKNIRGGFMYLNPPFIAGHEKIININTGQVYISKDAGYHQGIIYKEKIIIPATLKNRIDILTKDLVLEKSIRIKGPLPNQPIKHKKNYNHINNITFHKGRFYLSMSWFTNRQYGPSGYGVFDKNWNEIERKKYGWFIHDFQFFKDKPISTIDIINVSKATRQAPAISGIMYDGKIVFQKDPSESFCKAICWDSENIYLCGGEKAERKKRKNGAGIIYVLTHKFELKEKINNFGVHNIKGAKIFG